MTTTTTTTTTYRNDKTGATVTTNLSREEIAAQFAASAGGDNWMWYWLAKYVQDRQAQPARQGLIAYLADSFLYAIGQGLKRPMIRFQAGARRYKVYLSKRGTLCFKAGAVVPGTSKPLGDEEYLGCLFQGRFLVNKDRPLLAEEAEALEGLTADPVGYLAARSKDMDRCSYCNLPLEDPRSKDVGYGETCSKRWGLPWGKSYDENVPSFAKVWQTASGTEQRNIRMMCQAVRMAPRDPAAWAVLGDALQDAGLKPVEMPERGVVVPQADEAAPLPATYKPSQGDGDGRRNGSDTDKVPPAKTAPVPTPEKPLSRGKIVWRTAGGTYDKVARCFTCEASTVGLKGAPAIIDFVGNTTTIPFVRGEVHRNNDNDVTYVDYVSADGTYSLVVLND